MMTMLSAVIKESKRGKKRKRHKEYSSDNSDSDWRESAENLGKNNVGQTLGDLSRNQGSDKSHLFTQNKLSNEDDYNHVTNYRSDVNCLTNNLFVYN